MADPGWAHAFRDRAAFEHDQVRGISKLARRMRVTRSIHLGEVIATRMPEESDKGIAAATPGSAHWELVVSDIRAAHGELFIEGRTLLPDLGRDSAAGRKLCA